MRTLLCAAATFASVCSTSWAEETPAAPAPGTQTARSVEVPADKGGKTTVHYWLALPPASEPKPAGGFPLMLFMHGAGEHVGKPEYKIYPDAEHDSWTATYGDATLYQWMLEQRQAAK